MKNIVERLDSLGRKDFKRYEVITGFDGAIDYLARIVSSRKNTVEFDTFKTIKEFSRYLYKTSEKSCGLEYVVKLRKIGGNAPNTGNALATLGIRTNCIGTFGEDSICDVFLQKPDDLNLITLGEPVVSTALEFNDGKVMLANLEPFNKITWERIKDRVGTGKIKDMFETSRYAIFVNWSEIYHTNDIWKGILGDIFPAINKYPEVFIDLSDPRSRSEEDVAGAIKLMDKFSDYTGVTLSLNENEAFFFYEKLYGCKAQGSDMEHIGKRLLEKIKLVMIIIHSVKYALLVKQDNIVRLKGPYIKEPKILTGGGDNFNAGFCFAKMIGFNDKDSLLIAVCTSGYYVKNGFSPDLRSLAEFIRENKNILDEHLH